jgi:CDP-diacylglycerol pyrophosphatase
MDISKYKPNGTLWSSQEDEELNNMYNEKLMDIIEISNIINRTPGSIISRLCKNKYISNRTSARGYIAYKNSELYKSIVASGEGKKINKQTAKSNDNISININGINTCEYIELKNDVKEIKNEIKELKNNLKQLIEMMKAVYEFEDI